MKDTELAEQAAKLLDESADELDEITVARLNAARARALDAARDRRRFGGLAGFWRPALVAGLLVVGVAVLLPDGDSPSSPAGGQLAAQQRAEPLAPEELEMLGELDFLLWLDETDAAL